MALVGFFFFFLLVFMQLFVTYIKFLLVLVQILGWKPNKNLVRRVMKGNKEQERLTQVQQGTLSEVL